MKILLLAGAGTSIELGVPGMVGMAEEFVDHAGRWDVEPSMVADLLGSTHDIEYLIEALDRISTAQPPLLAIGQSVSEAARVDKVRAEVEWFVQHAAERVSAREARLMWGAVLRAASQSTVTFVTTNYDRAIELAANAESIAINDGFAPFGDHEMAEWVGFARDDHSSKLIKLHGSTDWYATEEGGNPVKLRHPMPLFGRSALRLSNGTVLGSALVLPSREKLLTRSPYPRLSQMFLNAADDCDFAVILGSSLRDRHIREAAASIGHRAPVYLVNPLGSTYNIDGAIAIKQTASAFLLATFPSALRSKDPIGLLNSAASFSNGDSALELLRIALDNDLFSAERCHALERMDQLGLALDEHWTLQLMNDPDASVARYSLGLIPLIPDHRRLLVLAENSPNRADRAFEEDLHLLRQMSM